MKRMDIRDWLMVAVALVFFIGAIIMSVVDLAGCSAPQTPMENAALFSAQLNLCVANASTRLEADACRANVEMVWCGPGGALATSAGCKDGGR